MDDQRIRSVIADHLHVPLDRVSDQAEFVALGADSLDMVSLTMRFEEEFDLHIPEDAVEACTTVGNAMEMLQDGLSLA
jgi:acyl carrier protein